MGTERIIRRLRELLDVDTSSAVPGNALVLDVDGETWTAGAGGGADDQIASEVPFTPAGAIAASNVQDALVELDTEKQPKDSDLTAIAALTTTTFGRTLLELANQAALLAAAGAAASSHAHAGEDITSGTIADARIASTLARDSEVTAAVAAEATARDAAISAAIAALIASAPGVLDTLDEIAAALGDDPNFAATITTALAGKQPLDSDLTAIAALTTTSFGRSLLALADQAALLAAAGAAAASHAHAGEDVTSGTVADARIASTIARDSEVTAAIAAALAAADGAGLSDNGSGVLAVNVDGSTIEISSDSLRVKDSGITSAKIADGTIVAGDLAFDPATQTELDAHVNDTSAAHAASAISVADAGGDFTATDVEAALAELFDAIGGGGGGGGLFNAYALLRDEKSAGTNGGTFTSGAWRTRDLNTEKVDAAGIVSLASNQFTLGAGTYLIRARAPAGFVASHQARIYNVTDSAVALVGSIEYTGSSASYVATDSKVIGVVTLAATKTLELQHRCITTNASEGFGSGRDWTDGTVGVYSEVEILRVGDTAPVDPGAIGRKLHVEGSDYTTSSTSFVDVDSTDLAHTITTAARRVLILCTANIEGGGSGYACLDVTVDGTRLGGTYGLAFVSMGSAVSQPLTFVALTDVLSAGSHAFKLQWRVSASSVKMWSTSGVAPVSFSVVEQLA